MTPDRKRTPLANSASWESRRMSQSASSSMMNTLAKLFSSMLCKAMDISRVFRARVREMQETSKTNLRIAFKWLRQVPSAPSFKLSPCRRLSESPVHGFKSVHTGGRVLSNIWSPFTASKNSTSNPVNDADKTKASLLSDRSGRPSTRIL